MVLTESHHSWSWVMLQFDVINYFSSCRDSVVHISTQSGVEDEALVPVDPEAATVRQVVASHKTRLQSTRLYQYFAVSELKYSLQFTSVNLWLEYGSGWGTSCKVSTVHVVWVGLVYVWHLGDVVAADHGGHDHDQQHLAEECPHVSEVSVVLNQTIRKNQTDTSDT